MKTVLVADDEQHLRSLVCATVRSEQCAVIEAATGDEAWEKIVQHRPDIVLLDVQMPGRSGLDLARAIKGHPELATIPVILLSARAQHSDVAAGQEAGATHYLTKPFSPAALLHVVTELIGPCLEPDGFAAA